MATMNALEEIKKLDAQRAKLLEEATTEARKRADAAITDLNSLGHNYHLTQGGKTSSGIKRPRDPNKKCPICGQTGHDARKHRGETIARKKAAKKS